MSYPDNFPIPSTPSRYTPLPGQALSETSPQRLEDIRNSHINKREQTVDRAAGPERRIQPTMGRIIIADLETEYMKDRTEHISREARRQEKEALNSLGNNFWKQDPRIAPLRGALATWGLTINDLRVASFHGTSTVANDKNESDVICQQMKHLGRKKGNALLGIFQKYLTGHPKGAAGAFMFNGCLQVLNSGLAAHIIASRSGAAPEVVERRAIMMFP